MKKSFLFFLTLLGSIGFLFSQNNNKILHYNDSQKEAYRFNASLSALGYQSEDILRINYRKNSKDGMSWKKREQKYDCSKTLLTKEKLMSTFWVMEPNEAYILLFYSDDYFVIGGRQADPFAFGKYKIDNGRLVLYSYDYNSNVELCKKIFIKDEVYCGLNTKSDNLFYEHELVLNKPNNSKSNLQGISFFPEGAFKKDASYALVDGQYVITKKSKKTLSDNVKFRTKPSLNSDTQNIWLYEEKYYGTPDEKTAVIKKGESVTTYARTDKYETIDGVTACWYYISIPAPDAIQFGWIFGGYFEGSKKEKIDLSDSSRYEVHDLNMFLSFDYDGWNTQVYDSPDLNKTTYTLKKGDEVKITRFINVLASGNSCVEVEISNGTYGFISMKNPYKDGNFSHKKTLSLDADKIEILKFSGSFIISEGTFIKELPWEKAKSLHEITHKEGDSYFKASAITVDYKWVEVTVNGQTGWVPAKELSRDIGGPTIYTPEKTVIWELIDSNLI